MSESAPENPMSVENPRPIEEQQVANAVERLKGEFAGSSAITEEDVKKAVSQASGETAPQGVAQPTAQEYTLHEFGRIRTDEKDKPLPEDLPPSVKARGQIEGRLGGQDLGQRSEFEELKSAYEDMGVGMPEPEVATLEERLEQERRERRRFHEGSWITEAIRTADDPRLIKEASRIFIAEVEKVQRIPEPHRMTQVRNWLGDRGVLFTIAQNPPEIWKNFLMNLGLAEKRQKVEVPRLKRISGLDIYEIEFDKGEKHQVELVLHKVLPEVDFTQEEGQETFSLILSSNELIKILRQPGTRKIFSDKEEREEIKPAAVSPEKLPALAEMCEQQREEILARERIFTARYLYSQAAGVETMLANLFTDSRYAWIASDEWQLLVSLDATKEGEMAFGDKEDLSMRFYAFLGVGGGDFHRGLVGVREMVGGRFGGFTDEELVKLAEIKTWFDGKEKPREEFLELFRDVNNALGHRSPEDVDKLLAEIKEEDRFDAARTLLRVYGRRSRIMPEIEHQPQNLRSLFRENLIELAFLADKNIFCNTPNQKDAVEKIRGWVIDKVGGDPDDTKAAENWGWGLFGMWGLGAFFDNRRLESPRGREIRTPSGWYLGSALDDSMKLQHFESYRRREGEQGFSHGPDITYGKYPERLVPSFFHSTETIPRGGKLSEMRTFYEIWWGDSEFAAEPEGRLLRDLPWGEIRQGAWWRHNLNVYFGCRSSERGLGGLYQILTRSQWSREQFVNEENLEELVKTIDYTLTGSTITGGEIQRWLRGVSSEERSRAEKLMGKKFEDFTSGDFNKAFLDPKKQEMKEWLLAGVVAENYERAGLIGGQLEWGDLVGPSLLDHPIAAFRQLVAGKGVPNEQLKLRQRYLQWVLRKEGFKVDLQRVGREVAEFIKKTEIPL